MSAIRTIAVVGRDAPLWLAALALQRSLGPVGMSVTAVELPSTLSRHHAYAVSPALNGLHSLVGLSRHVVLRASSGIAVGGQRHLGWSAAPYFIAFDGPRPTFDGVDILQHWAAARAAGTPVPLERLSVAAVALARGKVGADGRDPGEFGAVRRGSHLDARSYSALLKESALSSGIGHVDAPSVAPAFDGATLTRLRIAGSAPVAADLYVDASGADAVLAAAQPGDDWQDWSDHLPARTLWWASAPALQPFPPFADLTRHDAGWAARIPLAERTTILVASEVGTLPDLAAIAGTPRLSDATGEAFAAGRRSAWRDNVVALGDAACRVEPVDLMALHQVHVGVANLIAWFPAAGEDCRALRDHVNGTLKRQAESVRDFQAARYRLTSPTDDALCWPERLEQRIALFAARGRLPLFDDDPFDDGLWALQLAGLGLVPRSSDPRARRLSRGERDQQFARLAAAIDGEVSRMPTVAADRAG